MPDNTKTVTVKRASLFLREMKGLKDQQWSDIIKAALLSQANGKKGSKLLRDEEMQVESETESDDEELIDPRYNDPPVLTAD
jgi:hypothetical protein